MEAGLPGSQNASAAPRLTRKSAAPKPGIVHFGPGAFFRAFNAIYTQEAMAAAPDNADWGVIAVSLRSAGPRDQMQPQGGVFTSVTLGPEGASHQVIGSIVDVLVAPEAPGAVLDALCDPAIRIVSLTITEKGYCHEPSTGRLKRDHPEVEHDLAHPGAPKTALGFIVEALSRRRAAGLRPFTVLTCDNLPSNGHLAKGVVLDLARARDAELAAWIEVEARFPSTMVDRITPATTEADIAALAEAEGYYDPACVQHEPFRQWVIEDDFVDGARPQWEAGGAQFVRDVANHETMKLRCLNGTHSSLAYLGYLGGKETIAETVADPSYAAFCQRLWREEILPSVAQPEGEDLAAYSAALLERYRNPSIRHRTWQIAMDGSQKLPQRILGTIGDALSAGRQTPGLCLAVAAWMRYVGAVDESGAAIDVRDPLAERLKAASDSAASPAEKVAALLGVAEVFTPELAAHQPFREAVTAAYEGLCAKGARAMVAELAQ